VIWDGSTPFSSFAQPTVFNSGSILAIQVCFIPIYHDFNSEVLKRRRQHLPFLLDPEKRFGYLSPDQYHTPLFITDLNIQIMADDRWKEFETGSSKDEKLDKKRNRSFA
jgi:hypothetical protein